MVVACSFWNESRNMDCGESVLNDEPLDAEEVEPRLDATFLLGAAFLALAAFFLVAMCCSGMSRAGKLPGDFQIIKRTGNFMPMRYFGCRCLATLALICATVASAQDAKPYRAAVDVLDYAI